MLGCGLGWGQVAPGGAKATMVVEPPTPLLRGQVGGLAAAGVVEKAAGGYRFELPGCEVNTGVPLTGDGAPTCGEVLKEDGLLRVAGADYGKAKASAYQFGDATGAFSAYTFLRTTMKGARVVGARSASNETSVDAGGTLVWAGTAVLRVVGTVTKEELTGLVSGLPKVSGARGLAPLLPTLFEKDGLDAGSMRYAIGPAGYRAMGGVLPAEKLGWEKSAEVATAEYHGKGSLTLLLYPTPQIAGDRGREVEAAVNADRAKFGEVKMRRLGVLVGVTTGGLSTRQAEELIAGMHVNAEVTFDQKPQPEFHAEVRKTASLLQNIAVLCGVLIVAAVLLGLFLGLGRAWIRKLQGKPVYTEPEFLTISLRDKPKALFAGKEEPKQ